MSEDIELKAMGAAWSAMEPLDADARRRVITWLAQKLSVDLPVGQNKGPKPGQSETTGGDLKYSTDTIANITGVRSGRDLIIAAAAHLHFSQGKQTFTRHDLAAQMRSAPSHFRSTFINNLTTYLTGLTRADRLRSTGSDTYALSNRERQALEAKLSAAG